MINPESRSNLPASDLNKTFTYINPNRDIVALVRFDRPEVESLAPQHRFLLQAILEKYLSIANVIITSDETLRQQQEAAVDASLATILFEMHREEVKLRFPQNIDPHPRNSKNETTV